MRPIALLRSAFIVLLLLGSSGLAQLAGDAPAVAAFAERVGLRDVTGFVETVQSLRSTGHLPPRYATKDEARAHGWRGGGLCGVWPGHVIGGDRFMWASDFPHSDAKYPGVVDELREYTETMEPVARAGLFGRNALTMYGIDATA